MTVAALPRTCAYMGNGSSKTFAIPFQFREKAAIGVLVRDAGGMQTPQALDSDFSISGGAGSTGSVTFVTAPPAGTTVIVYGALLQQQATSYLQGDTFPAESHEEALDRHTMTDQEQQEQLGRGVQAPVGDAGATMPLKAHRLNRLPRWAPETGDLDSVPPLAGQQGIVTLAPTGAPTVMSLEMITGAGGDDVFDGGLDGVSGNGDDYDGGFDG